MALAVNWEQIQSRAKQIEHLKREIFAEFIATFFFLLIGTSANVQGSLGDSSLISIQIAWGIGFTFAIYLALHVTGGHLNPSISLTFWLFKKLSFQRFLCYTVAQILGAFVGSALTFFGHYDDLHYFPSGSYAQKNTGALFFTLPTAHMSIIGSLFDQIIGTAILSAMVFLIGDQENQKIPKLFQPPLAGLVMTMIAMCFGKNGGFAINPARDLGPRIFCLVAGYGWSAFSSDYYYFWIPIVGPFIGAPLGALVYKFYTASGGKADVHDAQSVTVINEHRV